MNIDKALKVVVFKTITTPNIISFLNARLPLKITWDNNLFYSNDLPFSDNFPLPNAWGLVHCGFNDFDGCPPTLEGAIVITDVPDFDFWNDFATDSIWFNSDAYEFFLNYLDFQILPYSDVHGWGFINSNSPSIAVNPNITHSLININSCCSQNVFISNLAGNIVKTFYNINPGFFTINISDLPPGFYILNISNDNTNLNTKILKL